MLSFPLFIPGLQRICLGAKLNEAATRYSREGWDPVWDSGPNNSESISRMILQSEPATAK